MIDLGSRTTNTPSLSISSPCCVRALNKHIIKIIIIVIICSSKIRNQWDVCLCICCLDLIHVVSGVCVAFMIVNNDNNNKTKIGKKHLQLHTFEDKCSKSNDVHTKTLLMFFFRLLLVWLFKQTKIIKQHALLRFKCLVVALVFVQHLFIFFPRRWFFFCVKYTAYNNHRLVKWLSQKEWKSRNDV